MGDKLKSERRKCYEARDKYVECVERFLDQGKNETEANNLCKKERKGFDSDCPASWVTHFLRKYQFERYKKTLSEQGVNIVDKNALFFSEKLLTPSAESMLQKGYSIPDKIEISKTLSEILRTSLYHDPIVRENCLKLLEAKKGNMMDKDIVEGTRVMATFFFCEKNNKKLREKYLKISESFPICKQNILKKRIDLPTFEKCLYKSDVINFYFKKQIELENYEILKEIIINHGDFIDLYESIEDICKK
ncbi:unnamed protein product [Caenorhabditis angaria]|uniref:Uncharacterized protein n=1 Tax=Caenorhabditis angaria TaxID=860376 RepID=A0A9P1I564_9PELO|nr:unnamed protein product [Caenorhabditis angaria]